MTSCPGCTVHCWKQRLLTTSSCRSFPLALPWRAKLLLSLTSLPRDSALPLQPSPSPRSPPGITLHKPVSAGPNPQALRVVAVRSRAHPDRNSSRLTNNQRHDACFLVTAFLFTHPDPASSCRPPCPRPRVRRRRCCCAWLQGTCAHVGRAYGAGRATVSRQRYGTHNQSDGILRYGTVPSSWMAENVLNFSGMPPRYMNAAARPGLPQRLTHPACPP